MVKGNSFKSKSSKSKKKSGFWWGLVLGLILAAGAVYFYQNHYQKSELESKARKLEKSTKKEVEKAEKGLKKFFEK
jgi:uncharacterized protein HemX